MSDEQTPWTPPAGTPPESAAASPEPPAVAVPEPPAAPQPRYGEYAPGYVPPAQPSAPSGPPAYGQQQYGQPQYPQQQPYGQAPGGAPAYQLPAAPRTRNTVDLVMTIVMLVIGLIAMSYSLLEALELDNIYQVYGISGSRPDYGWAQVTILISQPLIYLLCLALTIPLLVRRRLSFWAPLSCGVLAAIVFWVVVLGALLSDPNIVHHFQPSAG